MVSIKDIARAAQVSHSTVSRALSNSPLVNPRTAERVRQIAEEHGFRVSAVARSLATRRTHTIGVVVTSIADPFVAEVVDGVEERALANGYSVILANCHADPAVEMRAVQSFHDRRTDGILVTASRVGARYMPLLSERQVPIVLINNQHPGEFVYSVTIDNPLLAREATEHLIELGHRRIGYIGDRFGFQSDTERFAGYRDVIEQADLGFDPDLVVHGDGTPEGGASGLNRLLSLADPPTAVFCYNDLEAMGALHAARAHGLRVPEDVSVVGVDDVYLAAYTDPPLTTMRQPKRQMGCLAAQLLLDLLTGAKAETRNVVPAELVVRGSTAAPRGAQ